VIRDELYNVTQALNIKKRKLDLRDIYAKVIQAQNNDTRDDARIRYLQERSWLRDDEYGIPF
jgi:hypothetical protein